MSDQKRPTLEKPQIPCSWPDFRPESRGFGILDGKAHARPENTHTRIESVYHRREIVHVRPEMVRPGLESIYFVTEGFISRLKDPCQF